MGSKMLNLVLPLNDTGYSKVSSFKYSSLNSGQGSYASDLLFPRRCHNSSAMCGAKGDRILINVSAVSTVTFPFLVARLIKIIIAEIAVLNRRFSISPSTFLITWCKPFNTSVSSSPLTILSGFERNLNALPRKPNTPLTPLSSHGLVTSRGPINIS